MFTPINRFKAYLSRLILTEIEILLDLFKGQSLVSIKNTFTKTKSRRKEIWFGTVSKTKVCRSYLAKESEKREEKKKVSAAVAAPTCAAWIRTSKRSQRRIFLSRAIICFGVSGPAIITKQYTRKA